MSDAKNLERLKFLLGIADEAFTDDKYFVFPHELKEIPALIGALQHLAGKRKPIRTPFWQCVTALDKAHRKLRLKKRLEDLFARPARIIPVGPMVSLWTAVKEGKITDEDKKSIEELDKLLNPLLRDINGKVEEYRTWPKNGLQNCSKILRGSASKYYKSLAEKVPRHDAVEKLLDFTAFLDFYWRSRCWMERYYQPLVELIRFGEVFNNPDLYDKIKLLVCAKYPDQNDIKRVVAEFKNLRNRDRVRRHRLKTSPKSLQ